MVEQGKHFETFRINFLAIVWWWIFWRHYFYDQYFKSHFQKLSLGGI